MHTNTSGQRPELLHFTTPDGAVERTVRALKRVGFNVELDTDSIDGAKVSTYTGRGWRGKEVPDIAAKFVDPMTKNEVTLGLSITGDMKWPFDWQGQTRRRDDDAPLAEGGNHDNNQPEIIKQLAFLVASAHFDVAPGSLPTWTPEYREWETGIMELLQPLYSDDT